jgi:acylphosphatase
MKKHMTVRVHGLVQGVFFRASTREKARSLNISGLVRNEPDGSVYIEAEGEVEALGQFIEWCKKGPSGADVQKCEVGESGVKNFTGFVIER